jgi:YfiH family protein
MVSFFSQMKFKQFFYIVFPPLEKYDFLISGFVAKNPKFNFYFLKRFLKKQLREDLKLAIPRQRHSKNILAIRTKSDLKLLKRDVFDGVLTNLKNIVLCVCVADCVPIFILDHKQKVVGMIHSGWRGALLNMAQESISQMIKCFKSNPQDITLVLGPFIQSCCYEISPAVAILFTPDCLKKDKDGIKLDLGKILLKQFMKSGVKQKNIFVSDECTFCNVGKYYSYRREKNKSKRMVGFIGIKK